MPPTDSGDIVVLRRADLADLFDAHKRAIIDEVRELMRPASAPPEPQADDLLTTAKMARVLGLSRTSFFRMVRNHPALRSLKQGERWPEQAVRAAVGALK